MTRTTEAVHFMTLLPAATANESVRGLQAVAAERVRQVAKWGVQSRPDGTATPNSLIADAVKARVDRKAADGSVTWLDILEEEVWEAFSEEEPDRLRAELVQVAAVAVSWVEDLDRKATQVALEQEAAELRSPPPFHVDGLPDPTEVVW